LIAESGFFRALFSNPFEENIRNEINLDEENVYEVKGLLRQMYHFGIYSRIFLADREMYFVIPVTSSGHMRPPTRSSIARVGLGSRPILDLMLSEYLIADKYDCPNACAESIAEIMCFITGKAEAFSIWDVSTFIVAVSQTLDIQLWMEHLSIYFTEHIGEYEEDEKFKELIVNLPDLALLIIKSLRDPSRETYSAFSSRLMRTRGEAAEKFAAEQKDADKVVGSYQMLNVDASAMQPSLV
jgi:hypothetical protein